jgi:ABC-type transport system substrate-binding protein
MHKQLRFPARPSHRVRLLLATSVAAVLTLAAQAGDGKTLTSAEQAAQRLRALVDSARDADGWAKALDLAAMADRLYEERVKDAVTAVWGKYAEERFKAGDYFTARKYVDLIEDRSLNDASAKVLGQKLKAKAEALVQEARTLDDAAAVARLQEALRVWPRLDGLRDTLLKRQGAYVIVYVGVRSLPERLWPATAWTDSEKQALDLLFERLVHEHYDEAHGEVYRPGLAAGLPEAMPGGRRVQLDRRAYWSDGRRVIAQDVRETADLLSLPGLPWRTPEWADLIELPDVEGTFRLTVPSRVAYFRPLSPLSFPVLPRSLNAGDKDAFTRAPVGSGPYRYAGTRSEDGRQCAVFVANPYYAGHVTDAGAQTGKAPPAIREIRLYVPADPVRAFQSPQAPPHLLVDLPAEAADALKKAGVADVRGLEDRRVYILAVNHKVPVLKHQNLRRALAHAIDREGILNGAFRGLPAGRQAVGALGAALAVAAGPSKQGRGELHRPANGPYPPKSWASASTKGGPARLYDPDRARTLLRQARKVDGVAKVELTLKYPEGDPRVERACRDIARQLGALGDSAGCPVRVRLVALPPRALRQALQDRDYELAYHHLDYADESYWLWPLFDPRAEAVKAGGSNYLGYQNDATLEGLFRTAMNHRDFARVRERTHLIHEHLSERMPLIPLWQLDVLVAVHPDLETGPLDATHLFGEAARWRLKSR